MLRSQIAQFRIPAPAFGRCLTLGKLSKFLLSGSPAVKWRKEHFSPEFVVVSFQLAKEMIHKSHTGGIVLY